MIAQPLSESDGDDPDIGINGLRSDVTDALPEWRIALRCNICGSWLTDPRSVKAGIGPRCAASTEKRG